VLIPYFLLEDPPNCILLDDAYQHRYVKAGFNVLLTAYQQPFFKDFVLPTGNLREPRQGYNRADIIIITKCPSDLSQEEKQTITTQLKLLPKQSVFFSYISYSNQVFNDSQSQRLDQLKNFTLVTGIANPDPLVEYLHSKELNFKHLSFPDHHQFSDEDLSIISKESIILTTEKDFVRLSESHALKDTDVWYLPIEFVLDQPEKFEDLVLKFTSSKQ